MNKSDRNVSVRTLSASLLLAGAFAVTTASATDGAQAGAKGASCLEETRKVVVWPGGNPKNQFGRVENHVVTICDGKVVSSKPERNVAASTPARARDGA